MAPITRIAAIALGIVSALASATPILAIPAGSPAFVENLAEAAAPSVPKLPKVKVAASATIIESCTIKGVAALTFDDGPGEYTGQLLKFLAKEKVKVTFFVNGENAGNILKEPFKSYVKTAYDAGHQIASHTWSHEDLADKTTNIQEQMKKRKLGGGECVQTTAKHECRCLTVIRSFFSDRCSGQRSQGHHQGPSYLHASPFRLNQRARPQGPWRIGLQGHQLGQRYQGL
jgi:hypothetical protein